MNLGTVHLTPGWATFGHVLSPGDAFDALQIGALRTQTDVKCRYPDGSIKHAILTAQVTEENDYDIIAHSPLPDASYEPRHPQTVVWLAMGDSWESPEQYFTMVPAKDGASPWLNGPLVYEERHVLPFISTADWVTLHPYLRAVIDVRSYHNGETTVDVTVENALHSQGDRQSYLLFVGDLTGIPYLIHDKIDHHYLTRWRKRFHFNESHIGVELSEVTPSFQRGQDANVIPKYWNGIVDWTGDVIGADFDLLGRGSLNPFMPAHGGRPEIAFYPDWTARYLLYNYASQKRFVLAHGDLAGSWPVHVREDDGRLLTIDDHPNYWLDPRAPAGDKPQGNLGATGPLTPDIAHQPSLAFIPYLVTGERYYADEMSFWANYCLLATYQDAYYNGREGSRGILNPNQVRGIGWALRNIADCAAVLPDEDPLKNYFSEKTINNLQWLDNYANSFQTPLGVIFHDRRPEGWGSDKFYVAMWEQAFVAYAIWRANQLEFSGGGEAMRRIVNFQTLLFTPDIRDGGAPYVCPVATQVPAGSGRVGEWYSDVHETYQGAVQFQGYYGPDARMSLLIAIELGIEGAQEAYDYLWPIIAVQPFQWGVSDLAARSGWAITS